MPKELFGRIREIWEAARSSAARSVNTAQVVAYWKIGKEIVEDEQKGRSRAEYGEQTLKRLAARLTKAYGRGFSLDTLKRMRQFFQAFPELLPTDKIGAPPVRQFEVSHGSGTILPPPRGQSSSWTTMKPVVTKSADPIRHLAGGESWRAGRLHPNLSWRHYRTLLRIDELPKRSFYEIEALKNNWSGRELERQINSLLYERLAYSKDKEGVMRLAAKGQEILKPADAFKDPTVIEFLGLPESPHLVEGKVERALIDRLQHFLLELGKGFAFMARQERLTLDGDHFYVDLVFYHAVLKCYVLVDLKTGKLSHQDLGQMQLYVNWFDARRRGLGDQPTLGLILCSDKNDAVVRYTLGKENEKIFASRYKLHLPTPAQLETELKREGGRF